MAEKLMICSLLLMLLSFFTDMQISDGRKLGPEKARKETWIQETICPGNELVLEIQFYVQDLLKGENATVYEVARASITNNSTTSFGQVRVLDDKLTAEPDYHSEELGRAQGLITYADLNVSALTMNLNFVFTSGPHNGSTISIAGRNEINKPVRELPIIGGTGKFRMARGYAQTKLYSYDPDTEYGVLQYNLFVAYPKTFPMQLMNRAYE